MKLTDYWQCILDVIMPRTCCMCSKALTIQEKHLCTKCMHDLPRTNFHRYEFNTMEQLFPGKTPIVRASGFFFHEKNSVYAAVIQHIKYHNMPLMGRWLAQKYAREIKESGFFNGIDYIVPVPLHKWKKMKRGYNQGEYIAKGLADELGIPLLTDLIIATKEHPTQTHKGIYERWLNTQGIYEARNLSRIEGKHVLIIDDVITTGATLISCAKTIANTPGVKISIATLAVARLD